MGRLSADQRAAIIAGQPVRQVWTTIRPTSAAHTAYSELTIDYGLFNTPAPPDAFDTDHHRVIDPGSRKCTVANPSPMVMSEFKAVTYVIDVSNADGYFNPLRATAGPFNTGAYAADPTECGLTHTIYIRLLDGTWSEITHMTYEGSIKRVAYSDVARKGTGPVGSVATIYTEANAAWGVLRNPFRKEHMVESDIWDATNGYMEVVTT